MSRIQRSNNWLISADAAIRAAHARYKDMDGIEIDAQPKIAPDTDGAWVQAWVWVPKEEVVAQAARGWVEQTLVVPRERTQNRGRPAVKIGD